MNKYPSTHHSFDINLAQELRSVDLAILVNHFFSLIQHNERMNKNLHNKKYWINKTQKKINENFPYWTERQLRHLTDKLVYLNIIEKGNFNKNSFDRTKWYAFTDEYILKSFDKELTTCQ